jgi:antitoxin (DNA-binding transcriptional repressor) of toxin-antitoxin stability system
MKHVKMHAAKTNFSKLITEVEGGEEIVVQRGDTPVAKIVRYEEPAPTRKAGSLRGQIWMSDDFDEIPEEFEEYL